MEYHGDEYHICKELVRKPRKNYAGTKQRNSGSNQCNSQKFTDITCRQDSPQGIVVQHNSKTTTISTGIYLPWPIAAAVLQFRFGKRSKVTKVLRRPRNDSRNVAKAPNDQSYNDRRWHGFSRPSDIN